MSCIHSKLTGQPCNEKGIGRQIDCSLKGLRCRSDCKGCPDYIEASVAYNAVPAKQRLYRLPSLTPLSTFLKACYRFALSGFKITEAEQKGYRRGVCAYCPKLNGTFCGTCGCNIKAKTAWESETCPGNRW